MNGTNVAEQLLERLGGDLGDLSPQMRKAAVYVLENPQDVGVSTVRQIAKRADVGPNTMVRLAQALGLDGYEDFRRPFRDDIRRGVGAFPDRARWLQSIGTSGGLGRLYKDMADSSIRNIEETFASISADEMDAAARAICAASRVYVMGVGVNFANAQNFGYLASTGLDDFQVIPKAGSTATDDLERAGPGDLLIAMTSKPYRTEVVEVVRMAKSQGIQVVGLSDSRASPIVAGMDFGFVVAVNTPQFFPSSVATIAVLETLLSFVVARAKPDVVNRVERFHARRHELGLYWGGRA